MKKCLFLLMPVIALGQGSADRIVRNVENTLTSLSTLEVQFTETFVWEMTGERQSMKGLLQLEGETRFRITTDEQVIVSDGKSLWTYNIPTNRVLVDDLNAEDDELLPRQILFRYTQNYASRIEGDENLEGMDCTRILLTSSAGLIPTVRIWVDKSTWLPRRVEQTDLDGNKTLFDLFQIRTNVPYQSSVFRFEAPKGAEVINMKSK